MEWLTNKCGRTEKRLAQRLLEGPPSLTSPTDLENFLRNAVDERGTLLYLG